MNDLSKGATLPQLMQAIAETNEDIQKQTEVLAEIKEQKEDLRNMLMDKMREVGTKSAKTLDGSYTAAIANKPRVTIQNEQQVYRWLRDNELDMKLYVSLNKRAFDPLALASVKQGEVPAGVLIETTEYLQLRKNKGEVTVQED